MPEPELVLSKSFWLDADCRARRQTKYHVEVSDSLESDATWQWITYDFRTYSSALEVANEMRVDKANLKARLAARQFPESFHVKQVRVAQHEVWDTWDDVALYRTSPRRVRQPLESDYCWGSEIAETQSLMSSGGARGGVEMASERK